MYLQYKVENTQSILYFQNKIYACSHYKYTQKFESMYCTHF